MKLIFAIAALCLASGVLAILPAEEYQMAEMFANFVVKYNKEYAEEEVAQRFETFQFNAEQVRKHNAGNNTWTMEINEFSDMMPEEF